MITEIGAYNVMRYHPSTLISRVLRAATAISVATLGLAFTASTPASATCSSGAFRAGDFASGISNAYNVQSEEQTPFSGEITGTSHSLPSDGDIYIINGSDFVQVGWYVGASSQLPYTSTPRMFFGEYYPGKTNGELLQPGPGLSWGTYYKFEIVRMTGNNYEGFLNGVGELSTQRSHFSSGSPAFNGEVDSTCTTMRARAYRNVSPVRSLQYQNSSRGWVYFSDSRFASKGYFSLSAGDIATDWAYG